MCCLRAIWVHPYTITPAKWSQIWKFWVACGVRMMS